MIKKKKTMLIIISVILSFQIFATTALASSLYLNVEGVKQEQSNWCWAATSKSIIDYIKESYPTQTQIVTNVLGSPLNQMATFPQNTSSLTNYGVTTTATQGIITFASIQNYISGWYSPIKATVAWWGGSGGHDYVIYGYYSDAYTNNVSYMDPGPDNATWNSRTYSSFVSNSISYWAWTFCANK